MKAKGFAAVLLLAALLPVFSEEGTFFPFVSNLDVELKNGFIRINWEDSADARGPVFIYRFDEPIHAASVLPRPFRVPYGSRQYIDEVEKPGTYYYLAAASDEAGNRYTAAIPYSTVISVTVGSEDVAGYALRPEEPVPDTEIRGISASVEYDRIVVDFRGGGKKSVLYRNTRPIRRQDDLLRSVIVGRGSSPPLADDYPAPGIPYYYALVPEEELALPVVPISTGNNATVEPVEVPLTGLRGRQRDNRIRTIPLPALNSGPAGRKPPVLSEEASRAAASIAKTPAGQMPFREPAVFLEDLETPSAGENAGLGLIVQGPFSGMDWETAAGELRRFLAIPRSALTESRARFYLGQAYYFGGRPRDALFEFLAAQTRYPNESTPWIDAALARMVSVDQLSRERF